MKDYREDFDMTNDPFDLDKLLARAKAQIPAPSAAFLETALANAYDNMPAALVTQPKTPSSWSQMLSSFGGWKSAAALTASTLAGLWIGYADWQNLASSSGLITSYDSEISTLDSFDGLDALISES